MARLKLGEVFLERYRLDALLGRGGMGEVWAATDVELDRPVAIKLLQRRFADHPEYARRFRYETKAIAKLNNPHIVRLYAADRTPDGELYMVMEHVQGITLRRLIKQSRRVEVVTAVYYVIQIADALRLAHATGIWHRDIKPENVIVSEDGHASVLDFGIAKQARVQATGEYRMGAGGANGRVGTSGSKGSLLMGTLRYMAPEQIASGKGDHRADLYAVGVVLYEMLTGRHPYDALEDADDMAILEAHLGATPHPIEELVPDVPEPLVAITMKLLAKSPAQRYQDAAALIDDLRAVLRDSVPPEHPMARRMAQDKMEQMRDQHFAKRRALDSLTAVEDDRSDEAATTPVARPAPRSRNSEAPTRRSGVVNARKTMQLPAGFVPRSPTFSRPSDDATTAPSFAVDRPPARAPRALLAVALLAASAVIAFGVVPLLQQRALEKRALASAVPTAAETAAAPTATASAPAAPASAPAPVAAPTAAPTAAPAPVPVAPAPAPASTAAPVAAAPHVIQAPPAAPVTKRVDDARATGEKAAVPAPRTPAPKPAATATHRDLIFGLPEPPPASSSKGAGRIF